MISVPSVSQNITIIEESNTDINSNGKHNSLQLKRQRVIVSSIIEYFIANIIIQVDVKDCLCFKWFSQSNATKLHNIVSSKLYHLIGFGVSMIFAIIGDTLLQFGLIFDVLNEIQVLTGIMIIFGSLAATFYALSLLLISNIKMIYLIVNTFDFWFKIGNIISANIALSVVLMGSYTDIPNVGIWVFMVGQFGWTSFLILICFIDALDISFKIKTTIGVFGSIYAIYAWLYIYFFISDVEWNPFDKSFKHSQISIKSMFISSTFNVALFMLKPFLSHILRCLRRKICIVTSTGAAIDSSYDIDTGNESINMHAHERCTTVYKRPHVQWR